MSVVADNHAAPAASSQSSIGCDRVGGTLLIVEDNNVQRKLVARALAAPNRRLLTAHDGASAVDMVLRTPAIDLMILDYDLPDMNGEQVVDALATRGRVPQFIVTTARGSERVAVEMMKSGAVDYLIKDDQLLDRLPLLVSRLLQELRVDRILAEVQDALGRSQQRMREIIDTNVDAFLSIDSHGSVLEWNKAAESMFGMRRDHALNMNIVDTLVPREHREEVRRLLQNFHESPTRVATRLRTEAAAIDITGKAFPVEISLVTLESAGTWIVNAFVQDISRRRELELQLTQSEKMASLGQLAAGVAHEINNPIAYVRSNVSSLRDYVGVFTDVIELYERVADAVERSDGNAAAQAVAAVRARRQEERLEDILEDVGELFQESDEGLGRVKEIVQDLKSFARLDEADVKETDINECIETTLKVVANELKYKTTVHRDLKPLPRLCCRAGQLNQVFMNLLVNAAQAIPEHGDIFIRSWSDEKDIYVSIQDTGVGIPPEHRNQLFTPFFTTKPVGTGTGLGLSISYGIIQKHGGEISVQSELGKGTTFTIRLPLAGVSE